MARPETPEEVGAVAEPRVYRVPRQLTYIYLAALVFCAGAAAFCSVVLLEFLDEQQERRNQICHVDERAQLQDVERLTNTYRFLADTPSAERDSTLTRAIVRGLPDTERDAREDDAPKFCDEPGLGRREPDPKVTTKRPAWLEGQDRSKQGQSRYQRGP